MKDSEKTKEQLIEELQQMRLAHETCELNLRGITLSEKLLQDIINHNPVSIQILDKDGYTLSVNDAFRGLFRAMPTVDISIFADKQLRVQGLRPYFLRLMQGEVVHFPDTIYNAHKVKAEFPDNEVSLQTICFPIFDSKGKPERYVVMHMNITERKLREQELNKLNEQLRRMTEYTEQVREDERKKLARELHDDFGTPLNAINMKLELVKQKITDREVVAEMDKVLFVIKDTNAMVLKIVSDLRSVIIEDLGIKAAVEAYVNEFGTDNKIQMYLDIDEDLLLDYETSFVVYKLLQGSLSNVARHSEADTVDIWLNRVGDKLEFIVADNGIGIPEECIFSNKSFGIIGMRERATKMNGSFEICREENRGTTLTIKLPLSND